MNLTIPGLGRPSVSVGHPFLRSHLKTHLLPLGDLRITIKWSKITSTPIPTGFIFSTGSEPRTETEASENYFWKWWPPVFIPQCVPCSHLLSWGQVLSSGVLSGFFWFSLLLGFFWIWFCLGDYTCKSNKLKEKWKKDNGPTILSSIILHPLLPPLQEITMTSLTKQFAHCQALKPYKWVFWLWGL